MFLGDLVHCPVQLEDDEWAALFDVDPVLAKRTRNALAREPNLQVLFLPRK